MMGSYRPPQHGYGPPPAHDPYARPGSTTYNQPPAGAHHYGSPVTASSPWNAAASQAYHSNQHSSSQDPLPPPPSGAPPTNAAVYHTTSYQGQTAGGGYATAPALPPRIPQSYGPPTTSAPPNAGQHAYQVPAYGATQPSGHQRIPSVPSAYHQEVSQNTQGWPQHPQYSNQPSTHHYDPPLPPRPGSQGKPSAGGQRYSTYGQPPPQQGPPGGASQYTSTPGQPLYQQHAQGQSYEQSPSSASVYSPDDPSHPNYQPPATYQTPCAYVAPPPPPKPQPYETHHGGPGYPPNEALPPRPSSVQYGYQQQYQSPPPAATGYSGPAPGAQYGQDQASQHPPYAAPQPQPTPGAGGYAQQAPPYSTPADQGDHHGYGRQTPSQAPPRPYSNPVAQHGYERPPVTSEEQPVSPLQSRQSVSLERPASDMHATAGTLAVSDQANHKPAVSKPASAFAFSSDWEHFGSGADEIDDTAMYGVKSDEKETKLASVELPAADLPHTRTGSEVSAPESFHPSPAIVPTAGAQHPGIQPTPPPTGDYVPTPPTGYPDRRPMQQPSPAQQSVVTDEGDYIPPMPSTPPAAQRPARAPIVIGGSTQSNQAPPAAPSFVMDGGAYQPAQPAGYAMQQAMQPHDKSAISQESARAGPPLTTAAPTGNNFVMGDGGWHQDQAPQPVVATALGPQQGPTIDPLELKKAQQEAADFKAKLTQSETELATAHSSIAEKDSLIAQRDGKITQKDAVITQKDAEIAQQTTRLNDLQASLVEITETFEALKTSTLGLEEQVKKAEAAEAELQTKLKHSEATITGALKTHAGEKEDLDKTLKEAQAGLAAALTEAGELKKQLGEEKAKAEAKAAEPVDIAPGLEPWFKGSLERFKEMLYTESKPIPVQEKLQVFMDFVNAEARLRGIDMPFGPKGEVKGFSAMQAQSPPAAPTQRQETPKPAQSKIAPPKESDGFVMVDSDSDIQYSPGGRPILNASMEEYSPGGRPILRQPRAAQVHAPPPAVVQEKGSNDTTAESAQKPVYQPFRADTPGSGPSSIGSTPAQTPLNPPPKSAYKPFSWKQDDPPSQAAVHPQTPPQAPSAAPATQAPVYKPLYKPAPAPASVPAAEMTKQVGNADILFDPVPGMKVGAKKDTIRSPQDETMLPLPLKARTPVPSSSSSTPAELPTATTPKEAKPPTIRGDRAMERLTSLVHADAQRPPSKRVQDLAKALDAVSADYSFIKSLTKTWEDKAATTRSQLEKERARRQAELEKRNNELFDSGEIGYGDFETLEGQAKEEEMRAKAEEDAEEYKSYSNEVFDVVFKRCQDSIGALVKVQAEAEVLLKESVAGENAVSKSDKDEGLSQAIQLLLDVHEKLEAAHAEIVKAVQERDRRYKLTQTKPLYAKGDIAGMKRVEKAFEEAEKKADVRARVERAERCKRIWKIMDTEMERGAGENEDFAADIIAAAEDAANNVNDGEKQELLSLIENTTKIIGAVYEDTMTLMRMFEQIDMQLNECEYEVSVASARLKGDGKEYLERLEGEKGKEDKKLREDGERRLAAVKDHRKEAEGQLADIARMVSESKEEREVRERKARALEEAKRRNGQI